MQQVGDLKKGLNPLSISQLTFEAKHVEIAVKAGLMSGILALAVRPGFRLSSHHDFFFQSFSSRGKRSS